MNRILKTNSSSGSGGSGGSGTETLPLTPTITISTESKTTHQNQETKISKEKEKKGVKTKMDEFQEHGQVIMKKLIQRVHWFLKLSQNAGQPFDPNLVVRVIAADREWAREANVYMRTAEAHVTDVLVHNQKKFDDFRYVSFFFFFYIP